MVNNKNITVPDDFHEKYCAKCSSHRCTRTVPWKYGCKYYPDYIRYKEFEDKLLNTTKEYGEIRTL